MKQKQKPPTIHDILSAAHPIAAISYMIAGEPVPFELPGTIQRRVRALAKKGNVSLDDVVGFLYPTDDAPVSAARNPRGMSGVLVPFGFWDNPLNQQKGVFAHELGHVKLGHIDRGDPNVIPKEILWEHEYEADRFAFELGVGEGLLEALRIREKQEPKEIKDGSWSHPPMRERLRRLEEMLSQRKVKKAA